MNSGNPENPHDPASDGAQQIKRDPVCGISVEPGTDTMRVGHAGTTYYFCSQQCCDKFVAHPSHYTDDHAPASGTNAVDHVEAIHTCPMHIPVPCTPK